MVKIWRNEDGNITTRTLFWLFLIVIIGYVAVKFVPPYMNYYMFKGEVDGEIQTAHVYSDQDIIKHILEKAGERDIPIEADDIILDRKESDIAVSIRYKVDVNFFYRYIKTLPFTIRVVKPIKSKTY